MKLRYMYSRDLPLVFEGYKAVTMSKDREAAAKNFVKWLVDPGVTKLTVVAEVENEPVGVVVVSIGQHPYEVPSEFANVDLLYVRRKHRHLGVAKELIGAGREWLQNNNVPAVFGMHRKENDVFWDEINKAFPAIQKVASVWVERYDDGRIPSSTNASD